MALQRCNTREHRFGVPMAWQNMIEVVDHAAYLLTVPESWNAVLDKVPKVTLITGDKDEIYVDMTYTTIGNKVEEPKKSSTEQRCQMNALFLCHLLELSTTFFHPAFLQMKMVQQSCTTMARKGERRSNLFWCGLMVERLYGACKKV